MEDSEANIISSLLPIRLLMCMWTRGRFVVQNDDMLACCILCW